MSALVVIAIVLVVLLAIATILATVRRYFETQTARLDSLLDEWVGPAAVPVPVGAAP